MEFSSILKILRGTPGNQYFEEFSVEITPGMNVISALTEIQKNPVNIKGERVTPVVWEQACLEEVCGSCSMLINGVPRQACAALVQELVDSSGSKKIALAPFDKFPLIRDLVVDRSSMFEDLKRVKAWVPTSGGGDEFGDKISPEQQEKAYLESTCMTCGCCLEACPQVNGRSKFVGAALINQVKLFNSHPTGKVFKRFRLLEMMKAGGIAECGNAQNCVQVCPKHISLTESISKVGGDSSKEIFRRLCRDES